MPDDSNRMAGLGGSDADGRASAETEGGSPGGWPAIASHYGEGYAGRSLGCGNGVYEPDNPAIIAVGPVHYADVPCGTWLRVCTVISQAAVDSLAVDADSGQVGASAEGRLPSLRCLVGVRADSCPGCSSQPLGEYIDLSEAGLYYLAGYAGASVVRVTVERWEP